VAAELEPGRTRARTNGRGTIFFQRILRDYEDSTQRSAAKRAGKYGADDLQSLLLRRGHAVALLNTLNTRAQHAAALRELGRFREAELHEVVAGVTACNAGTAELRAWHAVALQDLRRFEEPEAELRQLLETRTRLRRPDHSDVLGPRMNLALAVGELGRVAAGLAAARGPSTATHAHGPYPDALALRRLSRVPETESERGHGIKALSEIVGPRHQDTLRGRAWHRVLLHELGRLDEVRPELSAAVDELALLLGADYPHTLRHPVASGPPARRRLDHGLLQHRFCSELPVLTISCRVSRATDDPVAWLLTANRGCPPPLTLTTSTVRRPSSAVLHRTIEINCLLLTSSVA
jgi:hypothetical protein